VPDAGAYERFWQALDGLRAAAETVTMRRAMDALALIALTGARKGEVQRLRWRNVDLEGRRLVLGREEHKAGRKTGKTRIIALSDDAVAILAGYPRGDADEEEFVFAGLKPSSPIALQRPWERLARAAGLPAGITPHSFRHGVGTLLAADGLSAVQIAQALGHHQWRTSERYVHAVDQTRAALAQRTADLVRPNKLRAVR
jgi:integrase